MTYQAQQTWDVDSREGLGSYTRTHPIPESRIRNKIRNIIKEAAAAENGLEDIMDMTDIDPQDLKNRKE
jgi:predicted Zn-dependent protease